MTSTTATWILGLTRVPPGDRLEAWEDGRLRCTGTVSQVAPHPGLLWLLDDRTGIARLFSLRDHRLRRLRPAAAA